MNHFPLEIALGHARNVVVAESERILDNAIGGVTEVKMPKTEVDNFGFGSWIYAGFEGMSVEASFRASRIV